MSLLFLITVHLYVMGIFAYDTDYMRPKIDPINVKTFEKNFGWVVGIFGHIYNRNLFICQGALINPKIVLAPGLCIRKGTASCLKVRNYDSIISDPRRNFTLPIQYVERNVVKIFYHWKSTNEDYTSVSKRNLIMMVLDVAIIHYPSLGILQQSMERSVNSNGCLLVSLFENFQGLVILQKLNVIYTEISKCQSSSLIRPINDEEFPETSETTLCATFGEPITHVLPIGSTLICQYNEDPATLFLTGMLLQKNQYWSKHVKIENTVLWINQTLNEYKMPIKLFTE